MVRSKNIVVARAHFSQDSMEPLRPFTRTSELLSLYRRLPLVTYHSPLGTRHLLPPAVTHLLTSTRREVTIHAMRELLRRVFLVDLFKGMWVTFRYQAPKNIYTEQYPQERPMVAERYRGAPRLNMNPETGESLCISCNLCALACPENLIVVGWLRDDATRRKVLTTFTYDTSRCMFCGLCEDACPTDCLELTQDFEMASYSREGAIWDRHRLEAGPTPTHYTR
jgi:NADH-quinone oxidoreductase subunit I